MVEAMMWAAAVLMVSGGVALSALFVRGHRARWFKLAGTGVLAGLGLSLVGGTMLQAQDQEDARIAGGFDTIAALEAARADGVETKAEHDALLRERARRVEEEAQQAAACRQDVLCWAARHAADAAVACSPAIERLAEHDFVWIALSPESRLSEVRWADEHAGTLTYGGDRIRFRTEQGDLVTQTYTCDYDPASGAVLGVAADPMGS
ncbi:hypothetical protein [Roseospira navarrensis]|uniref:Uncharacterized protein n=1 Tax=Roseospira navarrensis TaxID=140058 RepID=A0A7X2D4R1_9PROT|nr:hypothetical protein [Roseospira navarrensis]MQX36862.1 hypothetical protein [Roseospira navarrensis]